MTGDRVPSASEADAFPRGSGKRILTDLTDLTGLTGLTPDRAGASVCGVRRSTKRDIRCGALHFVPRAARQTAPEPVQVKGHVLVGW